MLDIKDLQKSIHKHTITTTNALQLIKFRLEAELKEVLDPNMKKQIESDIRRTDAIIHQTLCLETMESFYKQEYGIFRGI